MLTLVPGPLVENDWYRPYRALKYWALSQMSHFIRSFGLVDLQRLPSAGVR